MSPAPSPPGLQPGDPRLIMRWARRYAKSRTISFLVQWVFIVLMVTFVGIATALTNQAYETGNMALVSASAVAMVACIFGLTWFSVSRWGGEIVWRVTDWLYGSEGYAVYESDARPGPMPWWITALGGGLVVHHLLGALLVSFGRLSFYDMQPFSACYMAPFLALMIVYQRLGFWAWLWPALYAAHAAAVVLDAPVLFRGPWAMLNMVVPVFGYGLLAIVAGHIYSRFALWQLQRLTRSGPGGPGEDFGGPDAMRQGGLG